MTLELLYGSFSPPIYVDHFEYEMNVMLMSITPNHGSSKGGLRTVIMGSHFSRRAAHSGMLRCRFNMTDSIAECVPRRCILYTHVESSMPVCVMRMKMPLYVER